MNPHHEAMDDSAEWAQSRYPYRMNQTMNPSRCCNGNCNQGRACVRRDLPPMPAEACTEVGMTDRESRLAAFLTRHVSTAETVFWLTVILALYGFVGALDRGAGL